MKSLTVLLLSIFCAGCATSPPRNVDDVCSIFDEKRKWYKAAKKATDRWQGDIATVMAFIHQESRFVADAKPPRRKILWVIPGPRKSDAYGYAQAKKATWGEYQSAVRKWGADRDDFRDAADFIAWYNHISSKRLRLAPTDTKNLYFAYHEGRGGFERGSYKNKTWLHKVANKVATRASRYRRQLQACEKRLNKRGWWFF